MTWNFDYNISAILFLTTLIVYFIYRKSLPLIYNKLFFYLMVITDMVAITDVVASVITSYGVRYPVSVLYAVNMVYYVCLVLTPAVFCNYAVAFSHKPIMKKHTIKYWLYAIPFIAILIIILITPFCHTIFSISEAHVFQYEAFRPLIFFETIFYLLIGGVFVLQSQKELRTGERYSIYLYLAISLFGHVYQVYINHYTQMVSMMNTVGLLIIFLIHQNPDYDRDRRSGMYR